MSSSITNELIYFAKQCTDIIPELTDNPVTLEGVDAFNVKLAEASAREFSPQQFPVLSELDSIAESPYTFNFHQIASQLKWRPSPRTDSEAKVIALCSFNEMLNLGNVVAGLMFMTPDQIYPEHQHAPQEVYFILSGNASWLYGGNENYFQQKPGDVVYNHPRDMHGMKTESESLLALYFLWGDKAQSYSY